MKYTLIIIFFLASTLVFAQNITPIASIQDSISVYNGQIVTIQGIITIGAGITNNVQMNAFIQDNSGKGIELFAIDIAPYQTDLIRGNELEITGEVNENDGVTEIKDFTWSVLSTGNHEPTPIYVTLSQELLDYEGTLVRAVGEITNSWYAGGATYFTIEDQLNYVIIIRIWDSTGLDLTEYTTGYLLEVVGVGGIYNNAFQILPGYQDQLREGSFDAPPQIVTASANSINSVLIIFSELLDQTSAEILTNYSIDNDLIIESVELQSNQSSILLTTSDQTEALLYTISANNIEDLTGNLIAPNSTIQFTGYEPSTYTQISDIQNNLDDYIGQEITVEAIVIIGDDLLYPGHTQFYVQDNSGRGIQVFNYDTLANTYVRGDLIEITGEIGLYTGNENKYYNVQIFNPSALLISQGNDLPEPYPVNGNEDLSMNGTWASATGEIVDIWDANEYDFYQITVSVNNVEMDLQFWDSTGANVEQYLVGDEITAKGVVAFYNSVSQLSCAYEEDIDYYIDDIYSDIDFEEPENPGEPVLIGFPYNEPCNSVYLYWKSNRDLRYHIIEMDSTASREIEYFATIPGQTEGTYVKFYISVIDTMGNEIIYPENFPDEFFEYDYPVNSFTAKLNIPAKAFNPYSGETFPIEFSAEYGDNAILRIYNAEGKLERTLFNDIIANQNGINQYDWDGRDKENNLLPLGLYICFLEVIDAENGNKQTAKAPIVIGAPLK